MTNKCKHIENYPTLVIHSTDNSFGFGYREKNNLKSDELFIRKFDNDLCNNLVNDFNKFISKEKLQKVNKISVSIGPANFNASRLIVVLARTISQQINCPLDSFSSFEIMAKRLLKILFFDAILFAIISNELKLSKGQFICCEIVLAKTTISLEALKFAGPILTDILFTFRKFSLEINLLKSTIKLLDKSLSNSFINNSSDL